MWEDRHNVCVWGVTRQDPPALHSTDTSEGLTLLLSCSDAPYAFLWVPLLKQVLLSNRLISRMLSSSKIKYKI